MTGPTRRVVLLAAAASTLPALAPADSPSVIHVLKGAAANAASSGPAISSGTAFRSPAKSWFGTLLPQHKINLGVPIALTSCHTGSVDGYFLKGHVPAAAIRQPRAERLEAVGSTVPGMSFGSPGMGSESRRKADDVLLVLPDGSSEVFTRYPEAQ